LQADVYQHALKKSAPVIDLAGLLSFSQRQNRRFSEALPFVNLGIAVVVYLKQGIRLDDCSDLKN